MLRKLSSHRPGHAAAVAYRSRRAVSGGLLVVLLLVLALSGPASAGTISVTTTVDRVDGAVPCSLREAVNTANQDVNSGGCADANPAAADTIRLAGGDYDLSRRAGSPEDANASGDLDVTGSVTIVGEGAEVSGIDGNGALTGDRVLEAGSGAVTISGLTIHDGAPTNESGGGILGLPGATLRVINSTVSGNDAGFGGGIYVALPAGVTLINSTVSGNTAAQGGGMHARKAALTNSTVSGNTASVAGGGILGAGTLTDSSVRRNATGGSGGGIAASGSLTLIRSTVSDNDSDNDGGGIWFSRAGTLNVTNSTLSGNRTPAYGGGLAVEEGTISLRNVTINRNVANGGGLAVFGTAAVNLRNTILAGNVDPDTDPEYHDWFCEGADGVVSLGYNLLPPGPDCTVAPATGDQTVTDPGLGQLANNGGKTLTHAVLPGSPALNTGHPGVPGSGGAACPATDQRGVPRSLGGRCDKGAYERVACQGRLVNRVGTEGPDSLVGTPAADGILALGGNDLVLGGSGGDGLCGGDGNDQLFGEAGPDFLDGGANTDTCNGGTETDQTVRCETTSTIP